MPQFTILLPTGQNILINLKSKESTGKHLKDTVFECVKILPDEKEYFGLKYSDKNDEAPAWISDKDSLKSLSFLTGNSSHPSIQLSVRIFPTSPDLALSTTTSRNLFRCHMKNMLMSNKIGCDSSTHAVLDSCIAQCELGDYNDTNMNKDYPKILNKLNIYAPSTLCAGTPIAESDYVRLVRSYHRKLIGVRPAQADILYLGTVQKIPLYGYKIYSVSDKKNKDYQMALSPQGIDFIYESSLENFTAIPNNKESHPWRNLVFAEQERNKVKLGFFIRTGEFTECYIKVAGKYSIKSGAKLIQDIELYKSHFLDEVDGTQSIVYDSRKKAQRVHSTKIPRRNSSLNRTVNVLGRSIRSSFRINRKKRNASEDIVESGTLVGEFEMSALTLDDRTFNI